jgi:Flp pilus assembly pilin Flp
MPRRKRTALPLAFLGDEAGASSVEYAALASGIAVAIAAIVTILSGNVQALYAAVFNAI